MADFDLRPGKPEDIDRLYEVHRQAVYEGCRDHYSAAQLRAVMESRGPEMYLQPIAAGRLVLAHDGGEVLGFVEAKPGEIVKLFVSPRAVGRGVGRALMRRGMALAAGSATVRVEATLNAQDFYAGLGFEKVGHGCWSHGNEQVPPIEVVIMEYRDA